MIDKDVLANQEMYNPGFEDELYKDRNQSFRKAVRAPKKNQRYLADKSDLYDPQDTSTASDVGYTVTWWTKYSWKRFLPWAPRAKGYVSRLILFTYCFPVSRVINLHTLLQIYSINLINTCGNNVLAHKN